MADKFSDGGTVHPMKLFQVYPGSALEVFRWHASQAKQADDWMKPENLYLTRVLDVRMAAIGMRDRYR